MNDYEGLYKAVVEGGPRDIKKHLGKISRIYRQEALDSALEKAITLSLNPTVQNVQYLLNTGANPNGINGEEGVLLNHAYRGKMYHIVELLLRAGADINAEHSNVLEEAVRRGDEKYVVRFIEAGADPNDTSRFLHVDNLLQIGTPKIQKYLIENGCVCDIEVDLSDVPLISKDDYTYPFADVETPELQILDYNKIFILVKGDTKKYEDLFLKYNGKYIPKSKGWLIPRSKKAIIERAIAEESESEDSDDSEEFAEVLTNTAVDRPNVREDEVIQLYGSIGDYAFMTTGFSKPNLFNLDGHYWDSVERYLMYKMYQGSVKAKQIREAEDLDEARRIFKTTALNTAKTPKQLVLNQKLQPLVQSKVHKGNCEHIEDIFYKATRAKFVQNKIYKNYLLNTDNKKIVNINYHDDFGYGGNLLGNTLMRLRHEFGGKDYVVEKTNSLTCEIYPGNNKFYVVRGDATGDISNKIRQLGTYRTKNGRTIRGKLNLNLQGGVGWLIPVSNKEELEALLFTTYPDEKKIEIAGREWINSQLKKFLEVAIIFAKYRDRKEVGSDDILFAIKDIFGNTEFSGADKKPHAAFINDVWEIVDAENFCINDSAINLLWDFISLMVLEFTKDIENYSDMKKRIAEIDDDILEIQITDLYGLTHREAVIVQSFNRIYRLLKRIEAEDTRLCVSTINIILGKRHYDHVRDMYAKRAKSAKKGEYKSEEEEFCKRFGINNLHVKAILNLLPRVNKKCKLLFLLTLDYIMDLTETDAIELNKRLIILSQKGTQVEIEEIYETPIGDIEKLVEEKPEEKPDKTPEKKSKNTVEEKSEERPESPDEEKSEERPESPDEEKSEERSEERPESPDEEKSEERSEERPESPDEEKSEERSEESASE